MKSLLLNQVIALVTSKKPQFQKYLSNATRLFFVVLFVIVEAFPSRTFLASPNERGALGTNSLNLPIFKSIMRLFSTVGATFTHPARSVEAA